MRDPTIAEIQASVCRRYRLPLIEMRSARRPRDIARPRQIAMYLCRQMTARSLPEIGKRFGGRDHTTVIHAIRQVEKFCAVDGEIQRDVAELRVDIERIVETHQLTGLCIAERAGL